MLRVATDIGGTFTDLVYVTPDGEVKAAKSNTTSGEFEKGVIDVIEASNVSPSEFISFVHGTTIVINAITEGKGAKTGLITTRGFRDILEIGRGSRPDFFNLEYKKPKPFVPRYLRRELTERINYKGQVSTPLDLTELPAILDLFRADGVEAIAISFINSYANPEHEIKILEKVTELWPDVSVVASHQITREWREYERTNTAVLSGYVQPIAHYYLDRLTSSLAEAGMRCTPYIMQSNCGIDTVNSARQIPITMIESGPASGIWGAAALGKLVGETEIIAIDIGGTTAKCSLITKGEIKLNTDYNVNRSNVSAGYPVMVPVVDLVEIGNGGGSIAWIDDYQRMHVGPQSAGADPGPVSYGMGGTEPTHTDAFLALGVINPNYFCGGTRVADMDAVGKAMSKLAADLKVSEQEAAHGIVRLATNNMVNAIKLISVNRGFDPRDFTLMAFGGGGGLNSYTLAKELNIKKMIIPKLSSVFSAWGMLLSDLRRDYLLTKIVEVKEENSKQIAESFMALEAQAIEQYVEEKIEESRISFRRFGRCRYQNQEHTVEIPFHGGIISADEIKTICERFHEHYEREYTYRLDAPVELVCYHLIAIAEMDKLKLEKASTKGLKIEDTIKEKRKVDFVEYGIHDAVIYDGNVFEPGMNLNGPAIIEESGTTIIIPPNFNCYIDDYGNYRINIIEEGE